VSSGSSSVLYRVLIVAEIDGADDKEPGDTTADVQTIFVAFLYTSLKSVCLNDYCFSLGGGGKKKIPVLGLLS